MMSKLVDLREIQDASEHIKLHTTRTHAELRLLGQRLADIVSSDAVRGDVKNAIDQVINHLHNPIIMGLMECYNLLGAVLGKRSEAWKDHNSETHSEAVIEDAALSEHKNILDNNNATKQEMIENIQSIYSSISEYLSFNIVGLAQYENDFSSARTFLDETLANFNSFTCNDNELTELMEQIGVQINRLNDVASLCFVDSEDMNLRLGASSNTAFLEAMQARAEASLDPLREAMEEWLNSDGATSFIGLGNPISEEALLLWIGHMQALYGRQGQGCFLESLPPDVRRLAERVKGNAIWSALIGDPVNAATGNLFETHIDHQIDGRYPLKFTRVYNSIDAYDGPLGRNWTHHFNIRIKKTPEGVSVVYEDSRQEHFDNPKKGTALFISEPSNENKLQSVKEGYMLHLTQSKAIYHFNKAGQLTKQIDVSDHETHLSYQDEKLIKVENLSGSFTFKYEGAYIKQVSDHTGRTISYEYDAGLLTGYTNPRGHTYSHEYDARSRLVKITNPEGHIQFKNVYDRQDRVCHQTYADGSEMSYDYDTRLASKEMSTTFTKQNGSKFIYKRDAMYRTTGIIEPDGETKIAYNEKSQRSAHIDKLGHQTLFEYDHFGNLSKVTNALGVVNEFEYGAESNRLIAFRIDGNQKMSFEYDEDTNLISSVDALSNKMTFSYKKKRLPEVITLADGSEVHISYDDKDNVARIKDEHGTITTYQYNDLNQVICAIDGSGHAVHFAYDVTGNITEVQNALGNTQTFTYDKLNKVTSITDFNGATTNREYNAVGKISKVTDPLGRETTFDYDLMWNVAQITEANGAQTKFCYNEMNHLESIVKPNASQVSYEYDQNGNRTKIIDEEGNVSDLTYDAINQLIEVTGAEGFKYRYTYNNEGKLTTFTDSMENVVKLEYDQNGNLIKETNALGDSRAYTYTPLGKVATMADEANRITTYEYELGGRLKQINHADGTQESYTYNPSGNLSSHTNTTAQMTAYQYDSLNRVIAIEVNGKTKTYNYDAMNNIINMTNELGHTTHYEYTLTGQLAKVVDALDNATYYSYNERDQLIEVRQEGVELLGHDGILDDVKRLNEDSQGLRMTKYHRNIMGQVEAVEDALGNKEHYTYSPKGTMISKLDKDGFLTQYGYNAHGDITNIGYADGKAVKLSYNPLRQLTEVQDWLGTTKITVDALGRTTKVSDHHDQVVEYAYGKLGERESITYPDGKQVSYLYDDALRLTTVNDGIQDIHYNYDQFNRLTKKQFGEGIKTTYHYNHLGQLSELSHVEHDQTLDSYHYSYDSYGNKTSIEKIRQGMASDSGLFNYTYDPLHRLSEVKKDGNLLRSYTYDKFGNRASMTEGDTSVDYTYNTLNQLILSSDGMKYEHDQRGNMTHTYQGDQLLNQYQFGALDRLESAFNYEQNLGATYTYNGFGHRIGKTEGTPLEPISQITKLMDMVLSPTRQIDDVVDLTRDYHNLLERKENGNATAYTFDMGMLSAIGKQGHLNYLHDDLGSPVRLVGGASSEQDVFAYDEFGTQFGTTSPAKQPFGFTGYQFDSVANTHFAQARQYSSSTGRFISQDLVSGFTVQPQSLNPYLYCWNQPMDFVDLDGLFLRRGWDALVGGGQAFVGAVTTVVGVGATVVGGGAGAIVGGVAGGVAGGVGSLFNDYGFFESVGNGARSGAGIGVTIGAAPGLEIAGVGLEATASGIMRAGQLEYNDDRTGITGLSRDDDNFSSWGVHNYRGQLVIRTPWMTGGMSLGPIMFLQSTPGNRLLSHEHGHFLEYQQLGFLNYITGIGLPSLINNILTNANYNNQPWEVHADMLAGVYRAFDPLEGEGHTLEGIALGMLYNEFLQSAGLISIGSNLWDFTTHNLSTVKEGRL